MSSCTVYTADQRALIFDKTLAITNSLLICWTHHTSAYLWSKLVLMVVHQYVITNFQILHPLIYLHPSASVNNDVTMTSWQLHVRNIGMGKTLEPLASMHVSAHVTVLNNSHIKHLLGDVWAAVTSATAAVQPVIVTTLGSMIAYSFAAKWLLKLWDRSSWLALAAGAHQPFINRSGQSTRCGAARNSAAT